MVPELRNGVLPLFHTYVEAPRVQLLWDWSNTRPLWLC